MLLTLTPQSPSAATLTIVNDGASDTGYELLQGASFGSPVWEHQFSAPRGTQGARPSQGRLPNRQVTLPIRVAGATKDAMATKISDIVSVVDEMRRFGGTCRMRSKSQTRAQNFDVLTATAELPDWNNRLEQRNRAVVVVTLTCGPYVIGDPMDVHDDFTTDNVNGGEANYTADAGALTNLAVTGGVLDAVSNLSTENRLIYTGNGYTYGDTEATIQATPGSTISSFKAGVILKRIDASNYLAVYVDDNGTNSRLRIDKVIAGSTTNLASTNLGARVVNGTRFWVRGRIEGNVVYAEHFLTTNVPTPIVAPTTSTSVVLTTAEAAVVGADIEGRAGIVFTPQQTAAFLDDFEVLPFTYRNPPNYVLDCSGRIPGDAPALASARMGMASGLTTTAFGLLAWIGRPAVENLVHYGDFEPGFDPLAGSLGALWSVANVAGVSAAATSINAVADGSLGAGARFGEHVGQVVCPATANTGAKYAMYRRFRAGQTYTAKASVRASSGTTNVRIRLGVSGDIASSTAVALSTTWTEHTATWTPTADVDLAYFAVEVTAATATTFQVDGVSVYRGTTPPSIGKQAEGAGASPPLATFRAEEVGTRAIRSGASRASIATANGGFAVSDTSILEAGESLTGVVVIEPGLADMDDYTDSGSIGIEVWVRVMLSSAFDGGIVGSMFALPETWDSNTRLYPVEYGQAGRTITAPSSGDEKWRLVRLGSFDLPIDDGATRWSINYNIGPSAGTNLQAFAVDDIYVIPRNSRLCSPTELTFTTGYPTFLSSGKSHRTVRPDLSSSISSGVSESAAGGICGSLLELPAGLVSVYALGSSDVPGSTAATSDSELQGFPSLHLSVRPRWHWLRS